MKINIQKDIRSKFGKPRDQGLRPTCLVFATSDTHACAQPHPNLTLSVEYLYFHAIKQSTPSIPGNPVSLQSVAKALNMPGQPVEAAWPYQVALPHSLDTWVPPSHTTNYRGELVQASTAIEALLKILAVEEPAILTSLVSQSFFSPSAEGVVQPLANEPNINHHALIAVGHGTSGGSGLVLVRNSWGTDWGINGYAWLDESYLATRLTSISTITPILIS